ncbi:MAG: AMP-binding protein, partial [bacterium]|nr:AMP-binding protein [bacterium]
KKLNEKAGLLAHLLRKKGIGPDKIAAIMMDNSLDIITGILAILKAGGAYLPLAADLPGKRVMAVLNDSRAVLLLTKEKLAATFKYTISRGLERQGSQKVVTPKRPPVINLDSLQFPDRSLVDYRKYHPYIGQSMVKNSITLQFSRGCMFKCLYCFKIWPDKYTLRTAENLFEEVDMYYKMGVRQFGFTDDLPNFNKKEIGKFYRLVIKHKLDIRLHFPNGIRGDILSPDFIDLMMEAGAVT